MNVLIFHAPDGSERAQRFKASLDKRKFAASKLEPISNVGSIARSSHSDENVVAIIWSKGASADEYLQCLRGARLQGYDVWIVIESSAQEAAIPAFLRYARTITGDIAHPKSIEDAAEKLSNLAKLRSVASAPLSLDKVQRMVSSRDFVVSTPSRIGRAGPVASAARNNASIENSAIPLGRALANINVADVEDARAHALGYFVALAGMVAVAAANRDRLATLFEAAVSLKMGLAIAPSLDLSRLFLRKRRDTCLVVVSAPPIWERRTTLHIDVLSEQLLPKSVEFERARAGQLKSKPAFAPLLGLRREETLTFGVLDADGLELPDEAYRQIAWSGEHCHATIPLVVPDGMKRTTFNPTLWIKPFDCEATAVRLSVSDGPSMVAFREIVSEIAAGGFGETFISYSRRHLRDRRIANTCLEQYYRFTGRKPFLDRSSIPAGEAWRKVIAEALERTSLFVLVWSEVSANSAEVLYEIREAVRFRDEKGHKIAFVIHLADPAGPIPDLPPEIGVYQWVREPISDV